VLCETCGAALKATARFCDQCGSPVQPPAAASAGVRRGEHTRAQGDRRVITALFADIVDYVRMVAELDPEVVQERMAAALAAMGDQVERLGGTREKFIGDAIFAVFGWPVARDDDAIRAALCGLSIRTALETAAGGEPLDVRVGIATGEVVATTGEGSLDENRLTGPPVVIAARLQARARPGEILVDEATVQAGRGRIGVSDRGDVVLRGHGGPVRHYAVEQVSGFETWAVNRSAGGPLVGREPERRMLADAIESCAADGRGSTILLEGEAGIGKSRLLAEAEAVAHAAGLRWTWTENVSYGRGDPFRFARVLAQALADEHGTDSGSFARQLLFSDDMDPDLARRYGGAIAVIAREARFSGWEAEAEHTPEAPADVAAALSEVADRYLHRLLDVSGPRAIVIDDLHWIDNSSQGMVDMLVARSATLPLVICAAMRPSTPPGWADDPHVRRIRLGGLRERESGLLATDIARSRIEEAPTRIDRATARVIHERTGGNPLFVTETVRAFLADRTLEVRDGRLVLADNAGHGVPITLRSVLGARIDALGPDARELLGVASVIGMRFRTGLLASVVGGAIDPDRLRELDEAAMIRPTARDGWRFAHPLIRDAAYSGLLAARRRELHGRVADRLEAMTPAVPVAWVARHRVAAGDRARAVPLLEEAALASLAMGADREAAAFWREAADLTDDPANAHAYRLRAAEAAAAAAAAVVVGS